MLDKAMVLSNAIMHAVASSSSPSLFAIAVSSEITANMDEALRQDLQQLRDSCFLSVVVSAIVVAVGVVLEGPELVHEVIGVLRRQGERKKPAWIVATGLVGWVLVVVGVIGEGVFEARQSRADSTLQTFNDILLTEAQTRAASAEEQSARATRDAGHAGERAAESNRRAAEADRTAEAEKLARVRIEARVAWRHLSEKQKAEIAGNLHGFASQEVASFWFEAGDTEAAMFASDIAEALRAARLLVAPPASIVRLQSAGKFGDSIKAVNTGVILQSTKDERSKVLADAIVRELNRRGFDARRLTDTPFEEGPVPEVWLNVEPRPEGPQGEFKLEALEGANKSKTKK